MTEMSKEQEFVSVDKEYLIELKKKAYDYEYFRGRVDGLEYIVDAIENALKRKEDKDGNV